MISFGERAGEFVSKLKEEESFDMPSRHKRPLLTTLVGFTLHADRRIKRRDRKLSKGSYKVYGKTFCDGERP